MNPSLIYVLCDFADRFKTASQQFSIVFKIDHIFSPIYRIATPSFWLCLLIFFLHYSHFLVTIRVKETRQDNWTSFFYLFIILISLFKWNYYIFYIRVRQFVLETYMFYAPVKNHSKGRGKSINPSGIKICLPSPHSFFHISLFQFSHCSSTIRFRNKATMISGRFTAKNSPRKIHRKLL